MEMTQKIKIFGATPSPYTQKILAAFRYRHIPYIVYNGNIVKMDKFLTFYVALILQFCSNIQI